MSRNFDVLYRMSQEQDASIDTSGFDLPFAFAEPTQASLDITDRRSIHHPEVLKLVRSLFLSSPQAPRHVVFCGVSPNERAAAVCIGAARALASEVSSRICLVDLGDGKSEFELHSSLFSGSLSSKQTLSAPRQIDRNLWHFTKQHMATGEVAFLSVEQMCSKLLEIRKEFGHVLALAPSIGSDAAAAFLGQVMDGVVFVLEANVTRRISAREAQRKLASANVRLLGTVLNNRTFPIPAKLYRKL